MMVINIIIQNGANNITCAYGTNAQQKEKLWRRKSNLSKIRIHLSLRHRKNVYGGEDYFSLNCLISEIFHVHIYMNNIKELGAFRAYISQENINVMDRTWNYNSNELFDSKPGTNKLLDVEKLLNLSELKVHRPLSGHNKSQMRVF